MGLIKAGMGALGGTLADQWKEFFYCDSLDKDALRVKAGCGYAEYIGCREFLNCGAQHGG